MTFDETCQEVARHLGLSTEATRKWVGIDWATDPAEDRCVVVVRSADGTVLQETIIRGLDDPELPTVYESPPPKAERAKRV